VTAWAATGFRQKDQGELQQRRPVRGGAGPRLAVRRTFYGSPLLEYLREQSHTRKGLIEVN